MFGVDREEVKRIKETYKKGTKVRLVRMNDPQAPPVDCEGTVLGVDDIGSIRVAWETGSSLSVVYGEDKVEIISA